jgi:hypothetical protein
MDTRNRRRRLTVSFAAAAGLCLALLMLMGAAFAFATTPTISDDAPVLTNPSFECDQGVYTVTTPTGSVVHIAGGWSYASLVGDPDVQSARIFAHGKSNPTDPCASEASHVERLEGRDSAVIFARDIETPPLPGKPFDAVLYQRISATVGVDYSVSGWLLSLCGGTANDCPADAYIAKMVGVDPTGGLDPQADAVQWVESRAPHARPNGVRIGWVNLQTSAVATVTQVMTQLAADSVVNATAVVTGALTIFARLNSPFQWHGNHGYIDAFSVMRAPTITMSLLPTMTEALTLPVAWTSSLSADILAIPGGNYTALVDIEARHAISGVWRTLVQDGVGVGSVVFTAPCRNALYQFRGRVRAEQIEGQGGVFPNHRYPGSWSEPLSVLFASPAFSPTVPIGTNFVYLPVVANVGEC